MNRFRNYKDSYKVNTVANTYKKMLENQTLKYVQNIQNKYKTFPNKKYNLWDTIDQLNNICDDSDPDTDLPQIIHAYQTGLSLKNKNIDNFNIRNLFTDKEWDRLDSNLKKKYECTIKDFYHNITDWDWLSLIGFIHDLGKILITEEYGSLEQWSVVGDTFPLGQQLSESYIYHNNNFHINNNSLTQNTYINNIGFENIIMSWGHDEYLASVLEKNNTNFPKEAIYIIRFHSFYCWHSPPDNLDRGYINLANDFDWYMLPLLKFFQKSDLYSKSRNIPSFIEIKNEFSKLIEKYINNSELHW